MRSRLSVVALATIVAFAAGCTQSTNTDDSAAASRSPSASASSASLSPTPSPTLTEDQAAFLSKVRARFPETESSTDEELIALADLMCTAIEVGGDAAEQKIVDSAVKEGYKREQAEYIISLAKVHFC